MTHFANEPPIDFSLEGNRRAMAEAIASVRRRLGVEHQPIIAGKQVATPDAMTSHNPCCTREVVGTFGLADVRQADDAVAAAAAAAASWGARSAAERGDVLRRLAQQLRDHLFELAAWEVLECAKPWREATADITEAIDFCEFYAWQIARLSRPRGADVPGEENRFVYLPRGVCTVIAPWNFPLAILVGMTTAALAAGNPVIMKPAEQSSVVAGRFMQLALEAGVPPEVLHYLPGRGEEVGAHLVAHPEVALIAFTGSRDVGTMIHETAAAASRTGGRFIKKVIAEMGGKNAIIIDRDADLDEAVAGVVYSAFGFQGQKCSACSRVIVLREVHDVFMSRLIEATRSLRVGPAEHPGTMLAAVIDEEARTRIERYIGIGRDEGKEALAVDVGPLREEGYFVGPHIFDDVRPEARIAQEEIFGPVLAVLSVRDLDEAFAVANGTDYALTGGLFSRSPAHLDRARREFQVGNLYLNRGITGALVGRQPFGGFRMSGIGSKAGGEDYLLQFLLPKVVTENTMRRGFAPPDETT